MSPGRLVWLCNPSSWRDLINYIALHYLLTYWGILIPFVIGVYLDWFQFLINAHLGFYTEFLWTCTIILKGTKSDVYVYCVWRNIAETLSHAHCVRFQAGLNAVSSPDLPYSLREISPASFENFLGCAESDNHVTSLVPS